MMINIVVNAAGQACADRAMLGFSGEHNATALHVSVDPAFADGIESYRMIFNSAETEPLTVTDNVIEFTVPIELTRTPQQWQLVGFKFNDDGAELIRKSSIIRFPVGAALTSETDVNTDSGKFIESEISEIQSDIADLTTVQGKQSETILALDRLIDENTDDIDTLKTNKVDRVAGKGLSTNDFTDDYKVAVGTIGNKVDKVSGKGLSTNDYTTADKTEVLKIKDKVDKDGDKVLSDNNFSDGDKTAIYTGSVVPNSWRNVQKIVRSGNASKVFKVGDQLICSHSVYGDLGWDVIGIDCDTPSDHGFTHSLTLQMHDCVTSLQFDGTEVLVYAASEIPAGTYNFSIVSQPWYTADNGKTFQFTLTQAVPAGGQIVLSMTYNQALAGKSVKTYASRTSTVVIETATISEGSDGTILGATDGSVENLNHIQRAIMGSNNYAQSAMRQWLNSDGVAGSVWTPQTNFDRPPTWVTSTDGFLNGLDADFKAVVGTVSKSTVRNTVTDGGGAVTADEQIFLLSRNEVYGGKELAADASVAYPYYSENSDLSAAAASVDTNRIKHLNGAAQYWWLRSPNSSDAGIVRFVLPTGYVYSNYASYGFGVAPACCII